MWPSKKGPGCKDTERLSVILCHTCIPYCVMFFLRAACLRRTFWTSGRRAHPAFHKMVSWVFPGVKWPGRGVNHPPPSSAEVKERVELYLYSPLVPSWPVLGWTLLYPYLTPQTFPLPPTRAIASSWSDDARNILCDLYKSRGSSVCFFLWPVVSSSCYYSLATYHTTVL